jgi:hypothetical protein
MVPSLTGCLRERKVNAGNIRAALLAPTAIAASHRFRCDHMLVYSSLSRAGAIAGALLMLALTARVAAVYALPSERLATFAPHGSAD